jgi:UPF0755 protein
VTDLFEHPALQHPQPPAGMRRSAAQKRAAAKRRRRRRRRAAIVVVLCLVVVGGVAFVTWDKVSGLFTNPFSHEAADYEGPGGNPVDVEIPQGATGAQMGDVLVEAGVVKSVGAFTAAFADNPQAAGIQPGTYQLLTQMKASDAVAALVKNEKIETKVTIPEGFTAKQVYERVAAVTTITQSDIKAALKDPADIGLPAEAKGKVEGWLYPATYVVQPGDDAKTLLSQMVGKTVAELDKAGVKSADRETVLKKASLVEREAKSDADRPKMARAIQNRLDIGKFLEIDASTAHGLGINGTDLTMAQNHDEKNPYALYVHKGLPPTPIANPGPASVDAVLHPADGDWIFWCTVNLDTGKTKFTGSYDEFLTFRDELRAWQAAHSK